MSHNSEPGFLGASTWEGRDSMSSSYALPIEGSSGNILASHFEEVDAIVIVREITLARRRLGVDPSSMLAQKLSLLRPEAIDHLFHDPDLEETCRHVYERDVPVQDQSTDQTAVDVITTPIIRVSADDILSSTAVSGTRSDTDPINGQHATRGPSKSVGSPTSLSPPRVPRKAVVKCPRSDCRNRILYKSRRGLREHLILRHALPVDQARHHTELAFNAFHDIAPRTNLPQRRELQEDFLVPAQTRVERDQSSLTQSSLTQNILAIGNQSTASATFDPSLYGTPLGASIVNTWPQRSSSFSSWPHTILEDQGVGQSELQDSVTSALRQNQPAGAQHVSDIPTTSTPIFGYWPNIWTDNVVLPSTREPRYPLAINDNSLQQGGLQRYDLQRYNTRQYGTQQNNVQQYGEQRFGVQQHDPQLHDQQNENDSYLVERTFPAQSMGWSHDP